MRRQSTRSPSQEQFRDENILEKKERRGTNTGKQMPCMESTDEIPLRVLVPTQKVPKHRASYNASRTSKLLAAYELFGSGIRDRQGTHCRAPNNT